MSQAGSFFDSLAERWDREVPPPEDFPYFPSWQASLPPLQGKRVADIGCGTGRYAVLLAGWVGPQGRLIAIDPSPDMLRKSRARLNALPQAEVIEAKLGDARLPPASLDHAFIINTFPHLRPWEQTLLACREVLRPGAILDVVHFSSRAHLNALHGAHRAVAGDVLPPVDELAGIFAEAGFVQVLAGEGDDYYRVRAVKPAPA